ncbi:MAG TPA: zinc-dependent peptidase [Alcaligenes sp.]|nr:zinc-dependent peptidase [Alcaligenes sp.]HRL26727.1 zinc-dependent peptidase [Alcaligenes sp.]
MFGWLSGRGARRSQVEQTLASMDDAQWQQAVRAHDFLDGLSAQELDSLRQRTAWLLASKQFTGTQGLQLDESIKLSIAVQAALPILNMDPAVYEGWTEIVLYPGQFMIPQQDVDEAGVVHEYLMPASGEAWDGGPVILSWEQSGPYGEAGMNVVIHEFAHKLDLLGGIADGMPPLHDYADLSARRWRQVLEQSFDAFEQALTAVEQAIPADVDPESEAATPWYDTLPLDPYAATNHAEFFAVSSEAFFIDPAPLAHMLPQWYELLRRYYRQDPLARWQARR